MNAHTKTNRTKCAPCILQLAVGNVHGYNVAVFLDYGDYIRPLIMRAVGVGEMEFGIIYVIG